MGQAAVLQTLNDQATDMLRDRIISGELEPGTRVLETELAEELGISRGTLRAALQQLCHEGLVVQKRFRSTYVTSLTAQDAYEVYTLRNTLEAMASAAVARNMTDPARAALSEAIAAMRIAVEARSPADAVEADYALHRRIVELAEHGRLLAAYSRIDAQTRLFLRMTSTLDYDLIEILRIHEDLAGAIMSGDADRAERLARDHNTPDGEKMVRMLQDREEVGA